MFIGYEKSGSTPSAGKVMPDMNKMEAELKELRYYMERNVELRTENLLKRIAVLESCNATLCDKLAQAHQEPVALKQQSARTLLNNDAEQNDCAVKLYVVNNQIRNPVGFVMQDKWDEHATAA